MEKITKSVISQFVIVHSPAVCSARVFSSRCSLFAGRRLRISLANGYINEETEDLGEILLYGRGLTVDRHRQIDRFHFEHLHKFLMLF